LTGIIDAPPGPAPAGSIDGVKRGVSSGDLVGVLPTYTLGEELASRSLVELKVPEPLPSVALWLTTQRQPLDGSPLYDMVEQIDRALSVSRCLA
jgi:DNA-binding transcriptional LysR family regulator